jgi:hypothetical protein
MVLRFIKTLWNDWPARMTGPLSLILLFIPILAPQFTSNYLGGTTLVWFVCFLCLIVAAYRAWLLEHRTRIAEKLDPLIEDANLLRQLWDKIQYDYRESDLIRFPLAGFDVKEWEEVHKQLLRLFFWTNLQAHRVQWRFKEIGVTQQPRLSAVMGNQNLRGTMNGLEYTKLLEEHAALLARQRQRLAG